MALIEVPLPTVQPRQESYPYCNGWGGQAGSCARPHNCMTICQLAQDVDTAATLRDRWQTAWKRAHAEPRRT